MSVQIESLAILGDRRTLAMVTKDGSICWYCPERFDKPSLFASLLDQEKGGEWTIGWEKEEFISRRYEGDSAILISTYGHKGELHTITDFMPSGEGAPEGICRMLEGNFSACTIRLHPAPNYGQNITCLRKENDCISIDGKQFFYSSHPTSIVDNHIELKIDSFTKSWMFLSNSRLNEKPWPEKWLDTTRQYWAKIASRITYHGPYEDKVAESIRAIRLLTHEESGGILAAGTTSLPEVPGGCRNYDYRYVWLRDAGMIVSALTRAGSEGTEERRFLQFICSLKQTKDENKVLFFPMYNLDQEVVDERQEVPLNGYMDSRPVTIGNGARKQLQLDTTGNILLAAKLIYNKYNTKEHWNTVAEAADFLAENWHNEDHGIWEENVKKHYTSSKVITACGLMYIAKHTDDAKQKKRWKEAEKDIRLFVKENCLNSEGAYAVAAGEEAVDISAILFPAWAYTDVNTPEVLATATVLERDYKKGNLYYRYLFEPQSRKEGAFLAGSLWMAQYWVYRNNLNKAIAILEEVMKYATDLGFFPEEADVENELMLGNIPQTFVHASFIGTIIDLKDQLEKNK